MVWSDMVWSDISLVPRTRTGNEASLKWSLFSWWNSNESNNLPINQHSPALLVARHATCNPIASLFPTSCITENHSKLSGSMWGLPREWKYNSVLPQPKFLGSIHQIPWVSTVTRHLWCWHTSKGRWWAIGIERGGFHWVKRRAWWPAHTTIYHSISLHLSSWTILFWFLRRQLTSN